MKWHLPHFKIHISFCRCAGSNESLLVADPDLFLNQHHGKTMETQEKLFSHLISKISWLRGMHHRQMDKQAKSNVPPKLF